VRREIAGGYVRKARRVGFEVAAYDTTRPLVIDPVVLSYSLPRRAAASGNADDATSILQSTRTGNAYVTASTRSTRARPPGQSGPLSPELRRLLDEASTPRGLARVLELFRR